MDFPTNGGAGAGNSREVSSSIQIRRRLRIWLPAEMTGVLVTTFHELRTGQSSNGNALETLTTAMSTSEAISTGYAAGLHAWYYGGGAVQAEHPVQQLIGTALKDAPDDVKNVRHYFNHVIKGRGGRGWKAFYEAHEHLP